MKTRTRILRNALVGLAGYAFAATAAHAITISGQEVGSIDSLCGSIASAQSGQDYEEDQLEAACGLASGSITLVSNTVPGSGTVVTDGTNSYIDVSPSGPGFFVLKFGTGNTGNDMFFFENLDDLNFLVWNDAELIAAGLPSNHVQSLSHYTYTTSSSSSSSAGGEGSSSSSSSGNQVPEPASTLVLLGLGLMGVGFTRRLKKAA